MHRKVMVVQSVLVAYSILFVGTARAAAAPKIGKSPTLGKKPPAGAVVLLAFEPGKAPSLAKWNNKTWQASPDGYMVKGSGSQYTVDKLGDMHLHLEFNIPGNQFG